MTMMAWTQDDRFAIRAVGGDESTTVVIPLHQGAGAGAQAASGQLAAAREELDVRLVEDVVPLLVGRVDGDVLAVDLDRVRRHEATRTLDERDVAALHQALQALVQASDDGLLVAAEPGVDVLVGGSCFSAQVISSNT